MLPDSGRHSSSSSGEIEMYGSKTVGSLKVRAPQPVGWWLVAAPTPSAAGSDQGRGYEAWSVSAPCLVRGFKYPLCVEATCSTIARHLSVEICMCENSSTLHH